MLEDRQRSETVNITLAQQVINSQTRNQQAASQMLKQEEIASEKDCISQYEQHSENKNKSKKTIPEPERKSMRIKHLNHKVDYRMNDELSVQIAQHEIAKKRKEMHKLAQQRQKNKDLIYEKNTNLKKYINQEREQLDKPEKFQQNQFGVNDVVFVSDQNEQLIPAIICKYFKRSNIFKLQLIGTNSKKILKSQKLKQFNQQNKQVYRNNSYNYSKQQLDQRLKILAVAQKKEKSIKQKRAIEAEQSKKTQQELEYDRQQIEEKMAQIAIRQGITVPLSKSISIKLERKARKQLARKHKKKILIPTDNLKVQTYNIEKGAENTHEKSEYQQILNLQNSMPNELKSPMRYEQSKFIHQVESHKGFKSTNERKYLQKILTGQDSRDQFAYKSQAPQASLFYPKNNSNPMIFAENQVMGKNGQQNGQQSEYSQRIGDENNQDINADEDATVFLKQYMITSTAMSNKLNQISHLNQTVISKLAENIISRIKMTLQQESQNFESRKISKNRHGYYTDVLVYIFDNKLLTAEVLTYTKIIVKSVLFVWNYESFKSHLQDANRLVCQYQIIRRMVKDWSMNYERQSRYLHLCDYGRRGRQNNLTKLSFFRQKCDTHV